MSSLIRRLKIERFRSIQLLTWYPTPGINVILGGGDVGKTTILDAIGLLFNPTNSYTVLDADYYQRNVQAEFMIEAVMSLSFPEISQQFKMNWPWEWDGQNPIVPMDAADDEESIREPLAPVYVLRVRGTLDFELAYEILQPDESTEPLSVRLRQKIGLVRLAGDDRNDRDLRLVQGSGLDRLLSDKGLRSRLGHEVGLEDVSKQLKQEGQTALSSLEITFSERALPTDLGLGITGAPGTSLNALVGLTASKEGVALPLASWGTGTRRLAALAIADASQGESPIRIVDEIEKGLEPYRQRTLIKSLTDSGTQVLITTHSAAALSATSDASLWYVDAKSAIGRLPNEKVCQHQRSDPDTFLARLAVVCEGATEVGFASFLLKEALGSPVEHGVWLTNGNGHEKVLGLLEGLADGGLIFAGLVDNEGKWPERALESLFSITTQRDSHSRQTGWRLSETNHEVMSFPP